MNIRRRRLVVSVLLSILTMIVLISHPDNYQQMDIEQRDSAEVSVSGEAIETLTKLEIKGRAAKTGYSRDEFGGGWAEVDGCDTRNIILARDLSDVVSSDCKVMNGTLNDPYTGRTIKFERGLSTSGDVQIDHVVALSNAWQTGAAYWGEAKRVRFANDPLVLLAVEGDANQAKSDGDAATWLPSNKPFRCQYVARQVAIKHKYELWTTQAENDAIKRVLSSCPGQSLPVSYTSSIVNDDD